MSRREGRDSDSRRHRSGFDREPSPKRSRRDGKPQTERVVSITDVGDRPDKDEKQRRRLQDALSLEAALAAPDSSKVESVVVSKESDRKNNGNHETSKHSSNPADVPRSRSFFQQHDERGSAAHAGRSYGRIEASERGERGWWRDAKDHHNGRETKTYETRQRDEKPQAKGDGKDNWRHDRFFEMEADPLPQPPSTRKRPAFSEKKVPAATQSTDHTSKEPEKSNHALGSERRVDRDLDRDHNPRHLDRQDRLNARDQVPSRREAPRDSFLPHDRHGGGGGGSSFRGRDRFSGRQGYRSGGPCVEKWKHDLFDDANKSPPRKNEEDQIAKVESLLAS